MDRKKRHSKENSTERKMLDMMTNKFVINVEEKVIGHAIQINIW